MNIHRIINKYRLDGDEPNEVLLLLSLLSISLGLFLFGFAGLMIGISQ